MVTWRRSFVLGAAVWLAISGSAGAADRLGTAGPFRSAGWGDCAASYADLMQGACDPPAVDESLPPAQRSEAHRERAIRLLSIVRMEEARKAVDEAVNADPQSAAALLLRARFAIPGKSTPALADVNGGLLLAPSDPNLLATRAYLLAAHGKVEQALNDANAAVRRDSGNTDALWIRAKILMDLRQFDAAEKDLSHALLVEPDGIRTRQWRAMLRFRINRYAEAIEDATGVLEQRRFDPTMLELRAGSRMALGQHGAAIEDLNQILGEPGTPSTASPAIPGFRQLYLQRAVLSAHIGRPQDALRDLDVIITFGGRQSLLALQVHLRKHGFPDVPIDGKRTPVLEDAAMACLVNQACGRGLAVAH